MLHAAGAGDRGLLISLEFGKVQWMYASKACGARHLHCSAACGPLDAFAVFSSVGSGFGNVGQSNYAAANAFLDVHAHSRRAHGMVACSLQWPLVGGAGMGADAFAAMSERQVAIYEIGKMAEAIGNFVVNFLLCLLPDV